MSDPCRCHTPGPNAADHLHLYTSGVFTNRSAFKYVFLTLLVLFALTIVSVIYQSYVFPATAPVWGLMAHKDR